MCRRVRIDPPLQAVFIGKPYGAAAVHGPKQLDGVLVEAHGRFFRDIFQNESFFSQSISRSAKGAIQCFIVG